MKVLLVWENVPETTKLYSLEGELAELAIQAAGHYGNANDNDAVNQLNEALSGLKAFGDSQILEAFDIANHNYDKVVICGFIM